ncbi:MAG: hypothetical protein IT192_03170 [Microbacteriaceae bacterium]|nr:hypothetical protein [Microbacteriaceae bacterium]
MIDWFAWVQVGLALAAGLVSVAAGLLGRKPNDYVLGAAVFVELLLIAQLVIAIIAPGFGNACLGNPLEFYTYLVSAIILVPVAGFWGLVERTKWSTVIIGVVLLAVSIMVYRMLQIWSILPTGTIGWIG